MLIVLLIDYTIVILVYYIKLLIDYTVVILAYYIMLLYHTVDYLVVVILALSKLCVWFLFTNILLKLVYDSVF